jgi:hypothetical protein
MDGRGNGKTLNKSAPASPILEFWNDLLKANMTNAISTMLREAILQSAPFKLCAREKPYYGRRYFPEVWDRLRAYTLEEEEKEE